MKALQRLFFLSLNLFIFNSQAMAGEVLGSCNQVNNVSQADCKNYRGNEKVLVF